MSYRSHETPSMTTAPRGGVEPMSRWFACLVLIATATPASVQACSLIPPPIDEMVREVGSKGVLISGEIVRAVDAKRKQPELIRADGVFIGDPNQREYVISRSDREYEMLLARPSMGCGARRLPPVGVAFARMFLVPVEGTATRNAGWRVHDFLPVEDSKFLDMIVDEARRAGRFQNRPPPITKYWWNAKDPSLPLPK